MHVLPSTKIKVIAATYGTARRAINVTQKIQNYVDQGYDTLVVDKEIFGDPEPGEKKHFGMVYLIGEREESVACCEGERIHMV